MAVTIQNSWEMPDNTAQKPPYLATFGPKSPTIPFSRAAILHPVVKRRRLDNSPLASGSRGSAARWFDSVNHNVRHGKQSNADYDHEPPFYLNPRVHDITPALADTDSSFGDDQARTIKDDSENEDLRSVIDDLTIENKRLRQLLSERRQPHNPQLDRDKLFEIRTCGLSSEKRLEFGNILQKFASTISHVPAAASQAQWKGCTVLSTSDTLPEQKPQKVPPYPHTDSAYASLSNSGLTSVRFSIEGHAETQRIRGSKNNNIQSYLHNIPDNLLPKHSPILSEKSKMRLVVKRLEQLFTGKNAGPGEHSQPLQQQKVSESAASAERHSSQLLSTNLQPEGVREANILPRESKMSIDLSNANSWKKQISGSKSGSEVSFTGKSTSGNLSLNQRPTRPLDLDIHRAQFAEENIEYIRHLGPPTPVHDRTPENADDGWVYLNLLMNMAQLHTINVTPAFARKSITYHSTNLELSKDARKIRWKGTFNFSEPSDGSDSVADIMTESSPEANQEPMRSKHATETMSLYNLASTGSSSARAGRQLHSLSSQRNRLRNLTVPSAEPFKATDETKPASAFDYKPIFSHHDAALRGHNIFDDSDSMTSRRSTEDSTGQDPSTQANGIDSHSAENSEDDAVLIYYKSPWFYCDLSADKQRGEYMTEELPSGLQQTLGLHVPKGWPGEYHHEYNNDHVERTSNHVVNRDNLPSLKLAPLCETVDSAVHPVELQASGIGGILPDDNFVMHVRRKMQPVSRTKTFVAAGVSKRRLNTVYENEIVSTVRFDLPPSKLPPPSYVFLPLSSESSSSFEGDNSAWASSDDSEDFTPLVSLSRSPSDTSEQRLFADDRDDESESCFSMGFSQPLNGADLETNAQEPRRFDRAAVLDGPVELSTRNLLATSGAGSAASIASNAESRRNSYHKRITSPEGSYEMNEIHTKRWTFY